MTFDFTFRLFSGTICTVKKIVLLEVRRQVAHLCFGVLLTLLLFLDLIDAWFLTAATLTFAALILYWKSACGANCLFKRMLSFFERDEHITRFPARGPFFFLFSTLLTVLLFPRTIALASILILAVGDSISHLYGRFLGRVKVPFFPEKNLEGHIVGGCIAALVSTIFVPLVPALVASAIAMLVEIPRFRIGQMQVDDNLLIPLAAGTTLFIWDMYFPFL